MNPFFSYPRVKDIQAFMSFYDQHAPALWKLILSAGLPADQAKTILSNTLIKAWQQLNSQMIAAPCTFDWLVSLAHAEGLPTNAG